MVFCLKFRNAREEPCNFIVVVDLQAVCIFRDSKFGPFTCERILSCRLVCNPSPSQVPRLGRNSDTNAVKAVTRPDPRRDYTLA